MSKDDQNSENDARKPKIDRFEKDRLVKLEKIVEMGFDPFGQRFDDHLSIAEARERVPETSGEAGPA